MLASEFINEWEKQHAGSRQFPVAPDGVTVDYVMSFYMRDDFDGICSGSDRHAAFVRWVRNNWDMLSRDVETAKAAMQHALRVKAMTRAVRV